MSSLSIMSMVAYALSMLARTVYAGGFEKHDWYPRLFPSYGQVSTRTSKRSY